MPVGVDILQWKNLAVRENAKQHCIVVNMTPSHKYMIYSVCDSFEMNIIYFVGLSNFLCMAYKCQHLFSLYDLGTGIKSYVKETSLATQFGFGTSWPEELFCKYFWFQINLILSCSLKFYF